MNGCRLANINDKDKIVVFYSEVIEHVKTTNVNLGWRIESYPNEEFILTAIENKEMYVLCEDEMVIAAAVLNHTVNDENNDIDWQIKAPDEKIATIHALAVCPHKRQGGLSDCFLSQLEDVCKQNSDIAIHLDVIDTNTPAYNLYIRNGYKEIDCIKMYYEVVGTREFWMMEKILNA